MRQVPLTKPFFALLGQGRVGRALAAYLSARNLSYQTLPRQRALDEILSPRAPFSAVLLAVSDSAIPELVSSLGACPVPIVHFSGSVRVEGARAFHPLYSFTDRALSVAEFETIPFIADPGSAAHFSDIFPAFVNPVIEMSRARDARYHALCVLLGNLPLLIQDRAARALERDYGLPRKACVPFLESLVSNFSASTATSSPDSLVAGPVARRDVETTAAHLDAVADDPLMGALYRLLVEDRWPEYPTERKRP